MRTLQEDLMGRNIAISCCFGFLGIIIPGFVSIYIDYFFMEAPVIKIGMELIFEMLVALLAVLVAKRWMFSKDDRKIDLLETVLPSAGISLVMIAYTFFRADIENYTATRLGLLQEALGLDSFLFKAVFSVLLPVIDGLCLYAGVLWSKRCWERKQKQEQEK